MREDLKLYTGGDLTFREKWNGAPRGEEPRSMGRARRRRACRRACRDRVLRSRARARRPVHVGPDRAAIVRESAAEHACRADAARSLHRGRAARPARARQAPGRARDLLCRAGARAGRDLVLRPLRLINTIKTAQAVSGVSKLHAVIGGFHLGVGAARLCRAHDRRAEGAGPGRGGADALHRPRLYRRPRCARCRSRPCMPTPAAASRSGSERCGCSIRASA